MTFTHSLSTNNYGEYKFIVDSNPANGTHTTIASALSSASSGDNIFVRPGTYAEDLTLKAGVNLVATPGSRGGLTTIDGLITFNGVGKAYIYDFELTNTGDFIILVDGSSASALSIENCILTTVDTTAVSYTSSSASSGLTFARSAILVETTGITAFVDSSAGTLGCDRLVIQNSGGSTTASTKSAGIINFSDGSSAVPLSLSGTCTGTINYVTINGAPNNTTALTINIAGAINATNLILTGGTATALVITGGNLSTRDLTINSTNANAISGAGTIQYGVITYTGSSSTNSVTTQTALTLQPRVGQVVQQVRNQTKTFTSGTTTIPVDDTIPQNTEGTELYTLAITPTNSSNILVFEFSAMVGSSVQNAITFAIFQDSTAGAIYAYSYPQHAAVGVGQTAFTYYQAAGTTSSTTFKIRYGGSSASTIGINGISSGRLLGGVAAASFTITEIKV